MTGHRVPLGFTVGAAAPLRAGEPSDPSPAKGAPERVSALKGQRGPGGPPPWPALDPPAAGPTAVSPVGPKMFTDPEAKVSGSKLSTNYNVDQLPPLGPPETPSLQDQGPPGDENSPPRPLLGPAAPVTSLSSDPEKAPVASKPMAPGQRLREVGGPEAGKLWVGVLAAGGEIVRGEALAASDSADRMAHLLR
ncbi:unnamed protein product [Rangifer tarandus platyrhynchus]|uniref:Uncharacterized protein n=2 Tax=Rangifer tarandus platyrhynchus TaxID=3082113 RepID=A0ABN8ZY59_RANTA|nr:unnamed protein product [Rangifer tarandus platyrhynchus]CAI9712379.1 unnamed protein product [Rangifer tarandus platyrhynchus]